MDHYSFQIKNCIPKVQLEQDMLGYSNMQEKFLSGKCIPMWNPVRASIYLHDTTSHVVAWISSCGCILNVHVFACWSQWTLCQPILKRKNENWQFSPKKSFPCECMNWLPCQYIDALTEIWGWFLTIPVLAIDIGRPESCILGQTHTIPLLRQWNSEAWFTHGQL